MRTRRSSVTLPPSCHNRTKICPRARRLEFPNLRVVASYMTGRGLTSGRQAGMRRGEPVGASKSRGWIEAAPPPPPRYINCDVASAVSGHPSNAWKKKTGKREKERRRESRQQQQQREKSAGRPMRCCCYTLTPAFSSHLYLKPTSRSRFYILCIRKPVMCRYGGSRVSCNFANWLTKTFLPHTLFQRIWKTYLNS